jgi:hypothetical protein
LLCLLSPNGELRHAQVVAVAVVIVASPLCLEAGRRLLFDRAAARHAPRAQKRIEHSAVVDLVDPVCRLFLFCVIFFKGKERKEKKGVSGDKNEWKERCVVCVF